MDSGYVIGWKDPRKKENQPECFNLKSWQKIIQCRKCKDKIFSRYEGEYRICSCGTIAVDQTQYYTRLIGNINDFIMEGSNKGHEEKG